MSAMGVGLLVEEHRVEIQQVWTAAVDAELSGERALEFAVGPMLRELSLGLRDDAPRPISARPDPMSRCAVLVRSAAGPARVAREFKLLHRALWDTLRRADRIVAADERRAADEWLDEALAAALERSERLRSRIDLLDRAPQVVPAAPTQPVRTQPVRTQPVRTQPVRTQPVLTQPVRTRPAPRSQPPPPARQRPPPLPWNRPAAWQPEAPVSLVD